MAAIVASVVPNQNAHPVAIPNEPFDEVTADEPPCPRHQDRLADHPTLPGWLLDEFSSLILASHAAHPKNFASL